MSDKKYNKKYRVFWNKYLTNIGLLEKEVSKRDLGIMLCYYLEDKEVSFSEQRSLKYLKIQYDRFKNGKHFQTNMKSNSSADSSAIIEEAKRLKTRHKR